MTKGRECWLIQRWYSDTQLQVNILKKKVLVQL